MENRKLCLAYLSGIKKDTREQGGLGVWAEKRVGGEKIAGIRRYPQPVWSDCVSWQPRATIFSLLREVRCAPSAS